MEKNLAIFLILPFLGFLLGTLISGNNEKLLFRVTITALVLHFLAFIGFTAYWITNGFEPVSYDFVEIYKSGDFRFDVSLYFDRISAVYMSVGVSLTLLVSIFSRYYLHRDPGYKRFFNTLMLFFMGLNFIVFSGNFETIFIGWEIMGITSFLLIAFYRDRFLPVKNALKVVSVFRLGDICLLLAIWLSHNLFEKNISFAELNDLPLLTEHISRHGGMAILISLLFFMSAAVKSAQFPFSSWLPRAMEGPTTSSAIFYGSLSVHLGIFLLLRTYPFWGENDLLKAILIVIGLVTVLIGTAISNVQSTVKTQIAYGSVVQIGIMFVEVGLGFHTLALIHFAGNAFLRTYQLLVSPSVLGYMIHDQFFKYEKVARKEYGPLMKRIISTIYILSIKEWNLDFFQFRYLWTPFKWLGRRFDFIVSRWTLGIIGLIYLGGILVYNLENRIQPEVYHGLTLLFSFIGMMLVLKAFTARGDARKAWVIIFASQLFMALGITMYEHVDMVQVMIFLSGAVICAVLGFYILSKVRTVENNIDLNGFHGHSYEHPIYSVLFLISALGLVGFPFTPTFLGIDLMFSHLKPDHLSITIFMSVSFVFIELAALRIYARLFLGQHVKKYHEIAYKSS